MRNNFFFVWRKFFKYIWFYVKIFEFIFLIEFIVLCYVDVYYCIVIFILLLLKGVIEKEDIKIWCIKVYKD